MVDGRGGRRVAGPRNEAGPITDVITSRDNRWLKEFRVALRGGVPTVTGAVGVEGVRLVEEALTSGCRMEAVLFGEGGERHRERLAPLIGRPEMGFPVLRTTDRLFEGLADTEHPQGVAALVVPRAWTLEEVLEGGGEWRTANGEEEKRQRRDPERAEEAHGSNSSWSEAQSPCASMSELKLRPPAETRETSAALDRQSPPSQTVCGVPSSSDADKRDEGRRARAGVPVPRGACAPLIVVLAGVQDPGNVGTILRTAAAFGATAAVTAATGQSGTASPYAPKALRASAGTALHLPIVSGMALGILLTQLKLRGIQTLASCVGEERHRISDTGCQPEKPLRGEELRATNRGSAPWEVDWCQAAALLVGNEGAGLPEEVVRGADARVHIPMASRVESLNAAAAATVVLYEAFRQRKRKAAV